MNWYVLFTRTGQEEKVEKLLKKRLNTDIFTPFTPKLEMPFRKSGHIKKELKPLFPGYVIVKSRLSDLEFINSTSDSIYDSKDIIRLIGYGDTEFAIRESEKHKLLSLFNDAHCIKSSIGIIEGNKIQITDGPLKGLESIVKKVDRHKRRAWIELELLGDIRLARVGLEIVKKI